ncbi:SET domain protein [Aspergillus lucknowensis]|uniref:SET domain-containing protein n=1 Tax=Aspergillus lucknowensis TaxID=176173 RepID=A0ABR4LVH8_9EURO
MSELTPISTTFDPNRRPLRRKRTSEDDAEGDDIHKNKKRMRIHALRPTLQVKVHKLVTEILASVYYDINYVCILRNNIRWDPSPENLAQYRIHFRESAALIDRVVSYTLDSSLHADPRGTLRRLQEFVMAFGWKMLSICTLAEGFRRACRELRHPVIWKELMEKFRGNKWSIEVFARSRDLDWRGPLLKYANLGLPKLENDLRPARSMWEQHPHHILQSINKKVRRPWYNGDKQIHINEPLLDPEKWGGKVADPTLRRKCDGRCDLCGSREICDCEVDFSAGSLIELVERPVTGTGVRALTNFKKGDILGLFIGELCPPEWPEDSVYALAHVSKTAPDVSLATISPRNYGNWTRYIAHSCNASLAFQSRTIGKRTVTTVEAVRDISAFQDLTVDYGEGYWNGRKCMCGEANCVSKEAGEAW